MLYFSDMTSERSDGLARLMALGLAVFSLAAAQQPLEPTNWTPRSELTLRTWIERSEGVGTDNPRWVRVELDVVDFWMQRGPALDGPVVWFARREQPDETTAPIEIVSSDQCPEVREAVAAFQRLNPPGPRFMLETPAPGATVPIPAARKDGADFRIAYRAGDERGEVQLRNLPRDHYAWADHTRSRLRHCWALGWSKSREDAGEMPPSYRPEW